MSILATLDTILGFIVVMLLLSIVVTSMVQFTQGFFRLRGRNLRRGLTSLLETVGRCGRPTAALIADNVLQERLLGTENRGPFSKTLLGVRATDINLDELGKLLKVQLEKNPIDKASSTPASDEEPREIAGERLGSDFDEQFGLMVDVSRANFLLQIRFITVLWAFLVAFAFQVSSIQLIRDLSTDPEFRAELVGAAERVVAQTEKALDQLAPIQSVTEQALTELAADYQDLAVRLEEVGGVGPDRDTLVAEVNLVLEGVPNREEITRKYGEILDDLYQEKTEAALRQARLATGELARLDLGIWKYGTGYYFEGLSAQTLSNWVGVLITTILLTFGAPFWFERLKELARLRSVFKRPIQKA